MATHDNVYRALHHPTRSCSVVSLTAHGHTRDAGLSGFLEYKKLDGSWRPFLFQTVDFQLMVYRVHVRARS